MFFLLFQCVAGITDVVAQFSVAQQHEIVRAVRLGRPAHQRLTTGGAAALTGAIGQKYHRCFKTLGGMDGEQANALVLVGLRCCLVRAFLFKVTQLAYAIEETWQGGIATSVNFERQFDETRQVGTHARSLGCGKGGLVTLQQVGLVEDAFQQVVYRDTAGQRPPVSQQTLCA